MTPEDKMTELLARRAQEKQELLQEMFREDPAFEEFFRALEEEFGLKDVQLRRK